MIVLGIDPGLSGALAIIKLLPDRPASVINCIDVPTVGDGYRRRVDVAAVLGFIQGEPPDFAVVERAFLMPDQDIGAGTVYMRAAGCLEAAVMGMHIPHEFDVHPNVWKKPFDLLKRDKEDARLKAISLFPTSARFFERKKDHNRAEAALLAHYGSTLQR